MVERHTAFGRPDDQYVHAAALRMPSQSLKKGCPEPSIATFGNHVEVRDIAERGVVLVGFRHPLHQEEDMPADLAIAFGDPGQPAFAGKPLPDPVLSVVHGPNRLGEVPVMVLQLECQRRRASTGASAASASRTVTSVIIRQVSRTPCCRAPGFLDPAPSAGRSASATLVDLGYTEDLIRAEADGLGPPPMERSSWWGVVGLAYARPWWPEPCWTVRCGRPVHPTRSWGAGWPGRWPARSAARPRPGR